MSITNHFPQVSGAIRGILKDYYVYAGETVSAGGLVEFINGIGSQTSYGTSTSNVLLKEEDAVDGHMQALLLSNNKVVILYGYGDFNEFHGMVCTVNGKTVTAGTDTTISSARDAGNPFSAVVMPDESIFIVHRSGSDKLLDGCVCKVNGSSLSVGISKKISEEEYSGMNISAVLLPNGNVFVAHSYHSNNKELHGLVCTNISYSNITVNASIELSGSIYSGAEISAILLNNGNVFIAHSRSDDYDLYAMVCTIIGTTITPGTDTSLILNGEDGTLISPALLPSGNVFVAHDSGSYDYLECLVCAISGTTITKGSLYTMSSERYSGGIIDTIVLPNGDVLVIHKQNTNTEYISGMVCTISDLVVTMGTDTIMVSETTVPGVNNTEFSGVLLLNETIFLAYPTSEGYLYGQVFDIDETNKVPTKNIIGMNYETQVRNATTETFNGVAKTSGTGGTATAHGGKVSVYVPNI